MAAPDFPTGPPPVPVSVFNYPGLNQDGDGLDCGTENSNLISIVDALDGYEVDGSIVKFGGEAFPSLLDESRFFFMTDMENESPSDAAFLPHNARAALNIGRAYGRE